MKKFINPKYILCAALLIFVGICCVPLADPEGIYRYSDTNWLVIDKEGIAYSVFNFKEEENIPAVYDGLLYATLWRKVGKYSFEFDKRYYFGVDEPMIAFVWGILRFGGGWPRVYWRDFFPPSNIKSIAKNIEYGNIWCNYYYIEHRGECIECSITTPNRLVSAPKTMKMAIFCLDYEIEHLEAELLEGSVLIIWIGACDADYDTLLSFAGSRRPTVKWSVLPSAKQLTHIYNKSVREAAYIEAERMSGLPAIVIVEQPQGNRWWVSYHKDGYDIKGSRIYSIHFDDNGEFIRAEAL